MYLIEISEFANEQNLSWEKFNVISDILYLDN